MIRKIVIFETALCNLNIIYLSMQGRKRGLELLHRRLF